jgi:phosphoribosylformylglycinamidine synthase subunit PurS
MKVNVLVSLRDEVPDAEGEAVCRQLQAMGFSEVRDARVGRLIQLEMEGGDERAIEERVTNMCKELLANSVVEKFSHEVLDE